MNFSSKSCYPSKLSRGDNFYLAEEMASVVKQTSVSIVEVQFG